MKDKAGFILPTVNHSGPPLKGWGLLTVECISATKPRTQPVVTSPLSLEHLSLSNLVLWEVSVHSVLTRNKQWTPCLRTSMRLKSYAWEGLVLWEPPPHPSLGSLHPDMVIQN